MMAVGETRQVDKLLLDVADFYDEEVDWSGNDWLSRLSQSLILAMGGLVLILALGVFSHLGFGRAAW